MINKNVQILLNLLVDSFRLPVHLRVICHQGIALNAHQSIKVPHELEFELGASIMDNLPGNSVQPEDVVSVDFCHDVCHQGCLGQNDVYLFGKLIHHHANGIVSR